jgi:hypothetical protein
MPPRARSLEFSCFVLQKSPKLRSKLVTWGSAGAQRRLLLDAFVLKDHIPENVLANSPTFRLEPVKVAKIPSFFDYLRNTRCRRELFLGNTQRYSLFRRHVWVGKYFIRGKAPRQRVPSHEISISNAPNLQLEISGYICGGNLSTITENQSQVSFSAQPYNYRLSLNTSSNDAFNLISHQIGLAFGFIIGVIHRLQLAVSKVSIYSGGDKAEECSHCKGYLHINCRSVIICPLLVFFASSGTCNSTLIFCGLRSSDCWI